MVCIYYTLLLPYVWGYVSPVSYCYLLGSGVVSLFFYILILDIELILTCLQVVFDEYWMKMGWPGPWVPNFCDS